MVDVHRRTLVAADEAAAVVDTLADPAHKIVTLTVSENGYHRSARTGDLDLDAADVQADLADPANPRTTIGLIARGLRAARRRAAPR